LNTSKQFASRDDYSIDRREWDHPDYDPDFFVDTVSRLFGCRSDAALSRELGTHPPYISKIRHRKLPVGSGLLVRIHEETGLTIKELRNLMIRQATDIVENIKKPVAIATLSATAAQGLSRNKIVWRYAGGNSIHIEVSDAPLRIVVQAYSRQHRITAGIENRGNKTELLLPRRQEVLNCGATLGRELLLLAYSALSLFDGLSGTADGPIDRALLAERINVIGSYVSLEAAMERLGKK
jgi:hypothetical protein